MSIFQVHAEDATRWVWCSGARGDVFRRAAAGADRRGGVRIGVLLVLGAGSAPTGQGRGHRRGRPSCRIARSMLRSGTAYRRPRRPYRHRPQPPPDAAPKPGGGGSDGTMVRTWISTTCFVIAPRARRNASPPIPATPHRRHGRPHPTGRMHGRSKPPLPSRQSPLRVGGRPYMTKINPAF